MPESRPLIIAHRGASGLRPEHTLEGYALALAQGADVIEPDLVPSADGILFARHEAQLSSSTDISKRKIFADRQHGGDWRSETLLASELDCLRATQPNAGRSSKFDGLFQVPRWQAVLDWAAQEARGRDAPIILYPELKHPTDFIARGVDPVRSFIDSVAGLPEGVLVWVQCFEPQALRRVHEATGLPCCLLIDFQQDWSASITNHGAWLSRLGVDKRLLRDGPGSKLLVAARANGLAVDAWTYRDDHVGPGYASVEAELQAAIESGVDGLFCDFPATGLAVRSAFPDGRGPGMGY
jgi:glycerophosphoryl diester phosphodiesterase